MSPPPSPPPDRNDHDAALSPPRFGVGTLLVVVAGLCMLLAAFKFLGPMGGFALSLLVLAVLSHVAGNAIGTRLRRGRDAARQADWTGAGGSGGKDGEGRNGGANRAPAAPSRVDFAPTTRLHRRDSLGRPIVFATGLGAAVAAVLGGFGLARLLGDGATIANISLGVLASGVLGAIWSFVGFSFLQVAFGALWQASRHK